MGLAKVHCGATPPSVMVLFTSGVYDCTKSTLCSGAKYGTTSMHIALEQDLAYGTGGSLDKLKLQNRR